MPSLQVTDSIKVVFEFLAVNERQMWLTALQVPRAHRQALVASSSSLCVPLCARAAAQEAVALFVPVLHANLQKKLQVPRALLALKRIREGGEGELGEGG